jgi:hypothetical protein
MGKLKRANIVIAEMSDAQIFDFMLEAPVCNFSLQNDRPIDTPRIMPEIKTLINTRM